MCCERSEFHRNGEKQRWEARLHFVVSASMECVWYREVQLNAERHPHRCERSVAVEVMENGSCGSSLPLLGLYVAGLGM